MGKLSFGLVFGLPQKVSHLHQLTFKLRTTPNVMSRQKANPTAVNSVRDPECCNCSLFTPFFVCGREEDEERMLVQG
jgi:hypothetical protein